MDGFESGELLANAVGAVVAAYVPLLAAGDAVLAARASIGCCAGGARDERADFVGDVGSYDGGLGEPARHIGFEGVLVVIASAIRFACGFEKTVAWSAVDGGAIVVPMNHYMLVAFSIEKKLRTEAVKSPEVRSSHTEEPFV